MPAKPKRSGGRKGKYAYEAKKQGGTILPSTSASAGVPSPSTATVTAPRPAPARPTRKVADIIDASSIRFASVPKEIRTIGILAGVILILLIVLARVIT